VEIIFSRDDRAADQMHLIIISKIVSSLVIMALPIFPGEPISSFSVRWLISGSHYKYRVGQKLPGCIIHQANSWLSRRLNFINQTIEFYRVYTYHRPAIKM
jgi:hypothetical protein